MEETTNEKGEKIIGFDCDECQVHMEGNQLAIVFKSNQKGLPEWMCVYFEPANALKLCKQIKEAL